MSLPIIDTLKPLGNFPAVDASDVQVGNERLSTRLSNTPSTSYVDNALSGKVDKIAGKGLSTNDYTTIEKSKLSGIESNANNYTHPMTAGNRHIPAGGSAGKILGWASDGTAQWVDDHNTEYSDATTSEHGLMSAADKTKLNGIASGATNVLVDSMLSDSSTNAIQNKAVYDAIALKADATSVSAFTARISDVESEQSVLDARMDSFTNLAEGSTTGDAELEDIRVKADGTTASSAGSAVREQVNQLKQLVRDIDHNVFNANITAYTDSYMDTTGTIQTLSNCVTKVTNRIPVNAGDTFKYRGHGSDSNPSAIWFAENGTVIDIEIENSKTEEVSLVAPSNSAYAVFSSYERTSDASTVVLYVNRLSTNQIGAQSYLDYAAKLKMRLLANDLNWNTLIDDASYFCPNNIAGTNLPSIDNNLSKAGTLIVKRENDLNVVFQEYTQYASGNMYFRYATGVTPSWSEWKYNKTVYGILPDGSDFNTLANGSKYLFLNSGYNYSNSPLSNAASGMVETFVVNIYGNDVAYQKVSDYGSGNEYYRIGIGSPVSWRPWKIANSNTFSTLATDTDLNTLTASTYVTDNNDKTYINFPVADDKVGILETFYVPDNNLTYQKFTQWRTSKVYYRMKLNSGWTSWKTIDGDHDISILFVGNSLTQDGIAYLPYMLKTYFPEVNFKFYMWYNGGKTLADQYEYFTNDTPCDIFSVAENVAYWTNYSGTVTMESILETYKFDMVCMQEYFNYKQSYPDTTDWDNCKAYIQSHYEGGNTLEFISLFHAPKRDNADSIFNITKTGNMKILKDTISQDMIPMGIAVYRALSTDLDNLGDQGHLSPDGTHTQEGLPCLLQTYVALLWVLEKLNITQAIYGCNMRMTTEIYNSINVPGPNLGTGVITGTDAQNLLAQEVAIKAFKEGKKIIIDSFNY